MCLCVETIRITDGLMPSPEILTLHQERIDRTCRELYGLTDGFGLVAALKAVPVPPLMRHGTVKCRVVYGPSGIENVEYLPYMPPRIDSLLAVTDDEIDYTYKFCDRSRLAALHERAVAEGCGDALIVRRGLVTDTTICNIAFRQADSSPEMWHTPAEPLLRGTMREYLIKQGTIVPCEIPATAIHNGTYDRAALFNALNGFGSLILPVGRIVFRAPYFL